MTPKLPKCERCGIRTLCHCDYCSGTYCYKHSRIDERKKRTCFRCQAKDYIARKQEIEMRHTLENGGVPVTLFVCYACDTVTITWCGYCGTKCCPEHRVENKDYGVLCLECYRVNKEVKLEDTGI